MFDNLYHHIFYQNLNIIKRNKVVSLTEIPHHYFSTFTHFSLKVLQRHQQTDIELHHLAMRSSHYKQGGASKYCLFYCKFVFVLEYSFYISHKKKKSAICKRLMSYDKKNSRKFTKIFILFFDLHLQFRMVSSNQLVTKTTYYKKKQSAENTTNKKLCLSY